MARRLGQLEIAALAYAHMRNLHVVRTGDVTAALGITAKQERELLSRMARAGRITVKDLVEVTVRFSNMGTIRRIGALLEQMNAAEKFIKPLHCALTRSTAKIPFVPQVPMRGKLLGRWGVVVNA
jgi:predicted transcriptional regulator of viral defense system